MSKVTNSEYFQELKEWSRRKHAILTRYIGGAARILRTVYYLDAFAGAGIYGTGANREVGSPVLIAQFAKQIADEGRAYRLRCINIEENPEWFAELELVTEQFGDLVRNYQGTFVDHVDTVVRMMRG